MQVFILYKLHSTHITHVSQKYIESGMCKYHGFATSVIVVHTASINDTRDVRPADASVCISRSAGFFADADERRSCFVTKFADVDPVL